jgi:hypothetical protein
MEPMLITTYNFNDEDFVNVRVVNDIMTGASPSGASVSSEAQTIPVTTTSASGMANDGHQVAADTLPVNTFSDTRNAIGFDWQKAYTRTFRSNIGANFSKEDDYSSLGANVSLQRDTDDKLTTFTLGVSYSLDSIDPYGGKPDPLTVLVNLGSTDPEDHSTHSSEQHSALTAGEGDVQRKQIADVLFGITQVVSRRVLAQVNYGIGRSSGYLTDPYKIISRVNSTTGLTVDYLYESRPDTRLRQTLFLKSVIRLPSSVMHLSYRFYWDDWSILAHTAEAKYRFRIGDKFYLMPNFRYYNQSGADFFRYSMLLGQALPKHASADLRLAPMQSTTTGLKIGYTFSRNTEISLRAEYLQQWGEDNPASAVGTQRDLELFPKLQVAMYTFEFSYGF